MEEQLKPCPFCGNENLKIDFSGCVEYNGHEHQAGFIECDICGAEMYESASDGEVSCSCCHDIKSILLKRWNMRIYE